MNDSKAIAKLYKENYQLNYLILKNYINISVKIVIKNYQIIKKLI